MPNKFEKTLTDNPLLDEIMYNCRLMLADGIVLKDQQEADFYETVDSVRNSDIYMACVEGTAIYKIFTYDKSDISKLQGITNEDISNWAGDNSLIPDDYHDTLLKNKVSRYISEYVEVNRYYRMLNGMPSDDSDGYDADTVVYPSDVSIPDNLQKYIDSSKPLYLQSRDVIIALESQGVLDAAMSSYSNTKYLKYSGKRQISIHDSRKAEKFDLLYLPSDGIETSIRTNFEAIIVDNIYIMLKDYYDIAYQYQSKYFDKYFITMIIMQSVSDCICSMHEYYIRRDLFDLRTIEYYFQACGVEFFPDIPIRYQVSLVSNLNRLVKYKSTDKCISSIISLFGFDNIQIFKYYIIRSRKKTDNGRYSFAKYNDEAGNLIDDYYNNYELKFIKVPLDDIVDNSIKDRSNVVTYDNVTSSDIYWDGGNDHTVVENSIKDYDFNILRSKYISLNSIYSQKDFKFQMTYFINMLMNNGLSKDLLLMTVPYISMSINLVDAFIYMYALASVYYGTDDHIDQETEINLKILGFNFDADIAELSTYLAEKGYTTEDVGISGFQIPSNGFFTFTQLMEIYTKNKGVFDHVVHEMLNADNKRIYDIYKKIYDALMITNINNDYFVLNDGTTATSFKDFLKDKNPQLYYKYNELISITNVEKRKSSIATMVYNIACTIEQYLDMKQLPYIFNGLPAASIESVKSYALELINFFKSFKVEILDINSILLFDSQIDNKIIINDQITILDIFNKADIMPYQDIIINPSITMTKTDKYEIVDLIADKKYTYN